jgi:hypothetical protein
VLGIAASGADAVHDRVAADRAIHGAAEIDRVAENDEVIRLQLLGQSADELPAHHTQGAVAVRLKEDQQSAGKGVQRVEGRRYLVGVMAEIIINGHAARFADALKAREAAERFGRIRERHAGRDRSADRTECVHGIVPTGHLQPHDRVVATRSLGDMERHAFRRLHQLMPDQLRLAVEGESQQPVLVELGGDGGDYRGARLAHEILEQ